MGKSHQEQHVLKQEVSMAEKLVSVGERYWHYKSRDKIYKIIGLGFFEATDELCVIYQAEYGESLTFIRPLSVWLEQVEWEGKTVSRFTKL